MGCCAPALPADFKGGGGLASDASSGRVHGRGFVVGGRFHPRGLSGWRPHFGLWRHAPLPGRRVPAEARKCSRDRRPKCAGGPNAEPLRELRVPRATEQSLRFYRPRSACGHDCEVIFMSGCGVSVSNRGVRPVSLINVKKAHSWIAGRQGCPSQSAHTPYPLVDRRRPFAAPQILRGEGFAPVPDRADHGGAQPFQSATVAKLFAVIGRSGAIRADRQKMTAYEGRLGSSNSQSRYNSGFHRNSDRIPETSLECA